MTTINRDRWAIIEHYPDEPVLICGSTTLAKQSDRFKNRMMLYDITKKSLAELCYVAGFGRAAQLLWKWMRTSLPERTRVSWMGIWLGSYGEDCWLPKFNMGNHHWGCAAAVAVALPAKPEAKDFGVNSTPNSTCWSWELHQAKHQKRNNQVVSLRDTEFLLSHYLCTHVLATSPGIGKTQGEEWWHSPAIGSFHPHFIHLSKLISTGCIPADPADLNNGIPKAWHLLPHTPNRSELGSLQEANNWSLTVYRSAW